MYDKRDDKKEAVQAWQRVADTINSLRRMQSGIVWNIQNSHFKRQLRIWESVIPLSRRGYERPERTKGAYQHGDPEELYSSIKEREKKGYTSYGNLIALPHPNHLLAEHSFCSVALLEQPILWSENNTAQIIILCCASKDSARDLQMLFNFISLLLSTKRQN